MHNNKHNQAKCNNIHETLLLVCVITIDVVGNKTKCNNNKDNNNKKKRNDNKHNNKKKYINNKYNVTRCKNNK